MLERDAGADESFAAVRGDRIRVAHRRYDASDFRLDQRLDTRRSAPLVIAGLEVDVDGGISRAFARGAKREHFGVRLARLLVPALADDFLVAGNDAADARIRRGGIQALCSERKRPPHHGVIERPKRGN